VIVLRHPRGLAPERAYAARVVLGELLGFEHRVEEHDEPHVRLLLDGEPGSVVVPDVFFASSAERWLTEQTLPRLPLATRADGLPVLFGGTEGVGVDVFGSAFFMLTRYEEAVVSARDEHDRFPTAQLLAARAGVLDVPIVDEYAAILERALAAVWPRLPLRDDPPRVAISHDVDWPLCTRGPLLTVARAVGSDVRGADPGLAVRRAGSALRVRRGRYDADVCNTFDQLMDLSESRGLRSAFYFIASEDGDPLDGDYSLDEDWIRRLLRRIGARGHEIGLHPGYRTYRDPTRVARDLERLRAVCAEESISQDEWGGRQHFLRWSNPETWQGWADAGLDYDSTLGLSDEVGFRSGTCREHTVFNLRTREHLQLRERPLVVMDIALDRAAGSSEKALARVERLRRACRRPGGCFTLLWHNSRFCSRRERALYREIVARL
jgi:hypothetical protein